MRQRNLVLILARDLADKLASAAFVVDRDGTLVYFNERAAELIGETFAETGEVRVDEWARAFSPADPEGRPLDVHELPLARALRDRKPIHDKMRFTSADGFARDIAVTALPLFAHQGEFVGGMALFWEESLHERSGTPGGG